MRSIGYFASSGSGVLVPNIVDLSTSAASSALSAVGLTLGSSTGSTSSGANSGNNGNIASQSVASGTYVDYGTVVNYTTYSYTPPPPTCNFDPGTVVETYIYNDPAGCVNGVQRVLYDGYRDQTNTDCSVSRIYITGGLYDLLVCGPTCNVGGSCAISYSCATVGCSFCCPDPCYRSGTLNSSCQCVNPTGMYFC